MGYCIHYCMYCNAYYNKCSCLSSSLHIWKTYSRDSMVSWLVCYSELQTSSPDWYKECNSFFTFRVLFSRSVCHNLQLHPCDVHKLDKHLMHFFCHQTELNLNLSDWFSVAMFGITVNAPLKLPGKTFSEQPIVFRIVFVRASRAFDPSCYWVLVK